MSSEASADETPNSVAEKPDELISKHEAVTKVVEDTAYCKKTIKEVSEKPPKRKITHDMVLEEQYKDLLLKQSNLKLNNSSSVYPSIVKPMLLNSLCFLFLRPSTPTQPYNKSAML